MFNESECNTAKMAYKCNQVEDDQEVKEKEEEVDRRRREGRTNEE